MANSTSEKPTLVERLRHASKSSKDPYMHELHGRAADRIEELEKENADLNIELDDNWIHPHDR